MLDKIKLYTKYYCPYCLKVTSFLKREGISFEEVEVSNSPGTYKKIKEETGHSTVPIIFVNNEFIGGSREFFDFFIKAKAG